MILKMNNICKTYGSGESKVNALCNVNLQINKGEFVALVGPSGSGKSTLLHMLGAMDSPSEGEIILEGQDLGKLRAGRLANIRLERIGFIFQTFNLIPTLTALENVMLPMKLAGTNKKAARDKASKLLELVGLKDRMKHVPAKMSGGQRQRVAIARALANDPAIILADEPTGNLDSASGETIMKLMQELNAKGHTIIMVTHNDELADRAGRIVRMKDGMVS